VHHVNPLITWANKLKESLSTRHRVRDAADAGFWVNGHNKTSRVTTFAAVGCANSDARKLYQKLSPYIVSAKFFPSGKKSFFSEASPATK
jgi:hypothetical protein